MKEFKGRAIIKGRARGKALVTSQPLNITSGLNKPFNIIRRFAGVYYDRHHELYKKDIFNRILVFPQTIGSTLTGMTILELIRRERAPAAMIVRNADPLLASGAVLAEVWLDKRVPLIEIKDPEFFNEVKTGATLQVDGEQGTIKIVE